MTSASTKRRHKRNAELVRTWRNPTGTPVLVKRDNGETLETITESEAWLTDGSAFVRVRGIPGNTRLSRVTPLGVVEQKPSARRIKVCAPVVRRDGDTETIELVIGGRRFNLVGDGSDKDVRGLAVAIHTARSVVLEIEESSFKAPEDLT